MYNEQLLIPAADCEVQFRHPKLGVPSLIWPYHDENTNLLGFVCRFETRDSKVIMCRTLWSTEIAPDGEWLWRAWPAPRPLYGLDLLAAYPDAIVIVCEGEKAASAAQSILRVPDYVCITSPGGSNAAHKACWSCVENRTVYIWPDNDEAGRKYAETVAQLLIKNNLVSILPPTPHKPSGWDAADALTEGWQYA